MIMGLWNISHPGSRLVFKKVTHSNMKYYAKVLCKVYLEIFKIVNLFVSFMILSNKVSK